MSDRPFTHQNLGRQVRIEQFGKEVRLIFVTGTQAQSNDLCDDILRQLKSGTLNLTLMGTPTSIEET